MKLRTYTLSKLAVWALLLSTGVACVAGFFAMFEEGQDTRAALFRVCVFAFAAIATCALAVSQVAAGAVQRLRNKPGHELAFWLALGCAIICGLVSMAGVHLGAAVLKGEPEALPDQFWINLGGFALTAVKPAMGLVLEACEELAEADFAAAKARADRIAWELEEASREADRKSAERRAAAASAAAEAPAAAPAAPAASTPATAAPKRAGGKAARATATALRQAPIKAEAKAPQPIERPAAQAQPLTEAELQAAVDRLTGRAGAEGANVISLRRVAAEAQIMLGRPVPATQVERHPKRRQIFEAAKLKLAS